MAITKEQATEALRKATIERDEAAADLKRATERANKAYVRFNSALMVNGQFVEK